LKTYSFTLLLLIVLFFTGCKVKYSFSGADVNPNIKTVSIAFFDNASGNGIANMGNLFTDALREKILRETNLNLVPSNGDIVFSGKIVQYYYSVQAPTGNTSSSIRRITMQVNVDYKNNLDEKDTWNANFQNIAEHSVDIDLSTIEEESVRTINTLLVDDIFNKAFVKW
jgi:hypothetical protein